jgi:putative molybdopterin biosynthesis protein
MRELLTTDEAADYLRLSERKLYELVADHAVPCSKVTGRWLFSRAALDRWVSAGLIAPAGLAQVPAPPIVGGSHDPLLEWALREIAAIHLHRLDGDDETANPDAVTGAGGLHDAVVIAFARREQGIVVASGNPLGLTDMASIATSRARMAQRPAGAGAQLLLLALLARAGIALDDLKLAKPAFPTGPDIAQAIRAGRIDCGIATRGVAKSAGLNFLPLAWERFDLVMRQRDYFMKGPQALIGFMRAAGFPERAAELGGYDISDAGIVRLVN